MDISKHKVTSAKYRLNIKDTLKGLLMAVGTAGGFIIQNTLQDGNLNIDWRKVGSASVAAGGIYLINKFLSPAVVKIPVSDIEAQRRKDAGEETTSK